MHRDMTTTYGLTNLFVIATRDLLVRIEILIAFRVYGFVVDHVQKIMWRSYSTTYY